MGGHAFAQAAADGEPTLRTPRMSSDDYARLKNVHIQRLQQLFPNCKIAALLEAPEKSDYGDIDLKICSDKQNIDFIAVANRLGAAGVICSSARIYQLCSIAVPLDGSKSAHPVVTYKNRHSSRPTKQAGSATAVTEEAYAQIDIEVLPHDRYAWNMFFSSYGDMASLLGRIVTRLGFKISDAGLNLRMQEVEDAKRAPGPRLLIADAEGILFLSDDPARVMQFLGLSVGKFEAGFETVNAFFAWLAECRLISREGVSIRPDVAHEKQRQETRSLYKSFFNDWLPARLGADLVLPEEGKEAETERYGRLDAIRRKWQQEAIRFFDKRAEYEEMHNALLRSIQNQTASLLLKDIIAQHSGRKDKHLNEIVRAFRRWVAYRNGELRILRNPHSDAESELYCLLADDKKTLRDPVATSDWAKKYWEALRALERTREKLGPG